MASQGARPMTRDQGLAALQAAAASEHGVICRVSNPEAVVAALARIAKQSLRDDLLALRYKRVSLPEGNLVIMHGEAPEAPAAALPTIPSLSEL